MGPQPDLASLFWQLLNLLLILAWVILTTVALLHLRRRTLHETARAIWAALIIVVPILGAIAFLIVNPRGQ